MEIYIGNLPPDTSVIELRRLFGPVSANARFRICQRYDVSGALVCYGHAVIEPERRARQLVEQLHGRCLDGWRLRAREFVYRNPANERRAPLWHGTPWSGLERRKGERRNGRF